MPLLDHFHPPLSKRRHWQNLHSAWANALCDQLNKGLLPPRYIAEVNISLGGQIEVDLGTFETSEEKNPISGAGGLAVWSPPRPYRSVVMEETAQDQFEVQIFDEEKGLRLVAAVEFISPANKERPANRRAFAVKCGSYIFQGIGLVMVDVVTSRLANLHGELLKLLEVSTDPAESASGSLYATAYRSYASEQNSIAPLDGNPHANLEAHTGRLDYWFEPLALGAPLPILPLWLAPDVCLELPLEQAYQNACTSSRIAG